MTLVLPGGPHDAVGSLNYAMAHDVPSAHGLQDRFKSCTKCQQLFYRPFGGKCLAKGPAFDSKISGTDALASGVGNPLAGLISSVAQELGKEGATAAIALLVA